MSFVRQDWDAWNGVDRERTPKDPFPWTGVKGERGTGRLTGTVQGTSGDTTPYGGGEPLILIV